MDFEVETAKNGKAVTEMVLANNYDFALFDLEMPKMSGLQAALFLRSEGIQIPIFAFSAHDNEDIKKTVQTIAMDGWVTKPIKKDELKATLEKHQLIRVPQEVIPNAEASNSEEPKEEETSSSNSEKETSTEVDSA